MTCFAQTAVTSSLSSLKTRSNLSVFRSFTKTVCRRRVCLLLRDRRMTRKKSSMSVKARSSERKVRRKGKSSLPRRSRNGQPLSIRRCRTCCGTPYRHALSMQTAPTLMSHRHQAGWETHRSSWQTSRHPIYLKKILIKMRRFKTRTKENRVVLLLRISTST